MFDDFPVRNPRNVGAADDDLIAGTARPLRGGDAMMAMLMKRSPRKPDRSRAPCCSALANGSYRVVATAEARIGQAPNHRGRAGLVDLVNWHVWTAPCDQGCK